MSHTGAFVGLTQAQLNDLRSGAILRIANGDRTSISGGGKSGSKNWSMSAQDVLEEVVFAEQLNGTRATRSQKVVQDLVSDGRRFGYRIG